MTIINDIGDIYAMRMKYWDFFTEHKFYEIYFTNVQRRAKQMTGLIDGLCMIITAVSVSIWWLYGQVPLLWATLIAFAQVMSVLSSKFPFSSQLVATRFLLPELSTLLINISSDWNAIDINEKSDSQIEKQMRKHELEYHRIKNYYARDVYLPKSKVYIINSAAKDYARFFWHRYNVKVEGMKL